MRPKAVAVAVASSDLLSRHDAKSGRLVKYPKANIHTALRPAYPPKLPTRFPDEPSQLYSRPLLSGQNANKFNWLLMVASASLGSVCESACCIGIFSNRVTERICSKV